jgi:hypothetical protein
MPRLLWRGLSDGHRDRVHEGTRAGVSRSGCVTNVCVMVDSLDFEPVVQIRDDCGSTLGIGCESGLRGRAAHH